MAAFQVPQFFPIFTIRICSELLLEKVSVSQTFQEIIPENKNTCVFKIKVSVKTACHRLCNTIISQTELKDFYYYKERGPYLSWRLMKGRGKGLILNYDPL